MKRDKTQAPADKTLAIRLTEEEHRRFRLVSARRGKSLVRILHPYLMELLDRLEREDAGKAAS